MGFAPTKIAKIRAIGRVMLRHDRGTHMRDSIEKTTDCPDALEQYSRNQRDCEP